MDMKLEFAPTPEHAEFEAIASRFNWRIGRWVDPVSGDTMFTVWHIFSTYAGRNFNSIEKVAKFIAEG